MTAPLIDHLAAAVARLPQQYLADAATNEQKLLEALVAPFQAREVAQQQILAGFNVNTAVGFALDVIGLFVGLPRAGVANDDVYRRLVRAQIMSNSSDGLIDDLLTICDLVIFDPAARLRFRNLGRASYELAVEGVVVSQEVATNLARLLKRSTTAGVTSVSITQPGNDAETFVFGDIPDGFDGAHAAGETILTLVGDGLPYWPERGTLALMGAPYSGEQFAYVRLGPTSVIISPPLPVTAGDQSVERVVGGAGFGDATESGHPVLTSYANVGTTGGRFTDGR